MKSSLRETTIQNIIELKEVKENKKDTFKCIPMNFKTINMYNQSIEDYHPDEKIFIFDVDNTLYKQQNGMHENILDRIIKFAKLFIDDHDLACQKVLDYYNGVGLTIKGFLADYPDATIEKWVEMYDNHLDIEKYLFPDKNLQEILTRLKTKYGIRLWCLTNGSCEIGMRMLKSLDLINYFEGLIYCEYSDNGDFICKPSLDAYDFISELFNINKCENIYIFDDRKLNLEEPKKLGWNTYFIDSENCIKKTLLEIESVILNSERVDLK